MADPVGRPTGQPRPFGCGLLALAAVISLLMGFVGAVTGTKLTQRPADGSPANRQTFTIQESSAFIDAAKKVSPAVVSITAQGEVQTFFGPTQQRAGGTGFIVTNDGLIATNRHVVEAVQGRLTVQTNDGKTYPAEVKAVDPVLDFALIKIDAKNLPVVVLGDSNALEVGQQVMAIGNALGQFQNTVTTGVLSAKERTIQAGASDGTQAEQLDNLLQTDAAINPGNSGGPLLNLAGQVIGVNTAVADQAQGIGFAIPINQARAAIESYQHRGKIIRASLGVRFETITADLAAQRKLPTNEGALLIGGQDGPAVTPGSPAAKAGLKDGDIITAVGGTKLTTNDTLSEFVSQKAPGDTIELTVLRGGKEQKITVTLGER